MTTPSGRSDDLAASTASLTGTVAELAKQASDLSAAVKSNRRFTRIIAGLYTLDILLIVVLGGGGLIYKSHNDCQAAQNAAFQQALTERTQAANEERAAQRQLFNTVLDPAATPAQRLAASKAYYAGLVAADAKRNTNPLPESNCA